MGVIAFEEQRMFAIWRHLKNFAVVAGGHVQIPLLVQRQGPDVFGAGIEEDGRGVIGVHADGGLGLWSRRALLSCTGAGFLALDLVHLAIGRGTYVDGV